MADFSPVFSVSGTDPQPDLQFLGTPNSAEKKGVMLSRPLPGVQSYVEVEFDSVSFEYLQEFVAEEAFERRKEESAVGAELSYEIVYASCICKVAASVSCDK